MPRYQDDHPFTYMYHTIMIAIYLERFIKSSLHDDWFIFDFIVLTSAYLFNQLLVSPQPTLFSIMSTLILSFKLKSIEKL